MIKKIRSVVLTFILTVISTTLLLAVGIPTGIAFAEDKPEYDVKYYFIGEETTEEVLVSRTEEGTVLESFPGFLDFYNNILTKYSTTEGKKLVFRIGKEDGKLATLPYTVTENVNFYVDAVDSEETFTITYKYDIKDGSNCKEYSTTYPIGTKITQEKVINGNKVNKSYYDAKFTIPVVFPLIVEENLTFYPLFAAKTVTFTVNGKEYNCNYGEDVIEVTSTNTHRYTALYLDEQLTKPFEYTAYDGLTLYGGEPVRTHYAVTFTDRFETKEVLVLVPVENPILDESYFPTTIEDAAEWRLDPAEPTEFPLVLTDDIKLYASNGMIYNVTKGEATTLWIILAFLIAIIIWGSAYEHWKTVKKRKAAKQANASVATTENAEVTETNEPKNEEETPEKPEKE